MSEDQKMNPHEIADDHVEILLPARSPAVSMKVAPPPDIGPALANLRDHLTEVLAIPSAAWPTGREVELRLSFALVPTEVVAVVKSVPSVGV